MRDVRLTHDVGLKALTWLHAHRDGFRLEPAAEAGGSFLERFKPVGELALICKVLFREGVAGSRQAELARQLLDHAWREVLDGGRALVVGQRREPLSPVPFETYVPFRELGYGEPELERAIRINHRLGSWAALEVSPVRRLGVCTFERRYGMTPSTPLPEAAARTWLARTPEPWTVEGHIGYDITHTVFHLTDWGESPRGLPDEVADYLALWLPVWLDDWTDLRRWDLLGELLVVDACLPYPSLDEAAWTALAGAQSPDGSMPVSGADGEAAGGSDGGNEAFDLLYHPTLVAAFASALATSRAMSGLAPERA
ncbi:DUF6895 family protein [Streptantibioticus silvisoli]|uniref:DUF6895 domain-containing protein n=1 Tax=Streptantibioticus silvisoli TaxID=2705255 RepID=A0ABT6W186_9ACTN|nr:hypothetical protein [Streptantibioticus silvisoli]MDI5963276.1 hypothetical protein [Streptantibioticus silvisoli]